MTTETPATPAPETPVTPETPTPENAQLNEQEAEAAFAEGFNEVREDDSPTPTPKPEMPPEPKSETPETPAAATPTPEPEPKPPTTDEQVKELFALFAKIPGLEQQFNEKLNTEIRKVYNKFGSIEQLLKNLKPGQPTLKIQGALKRLEKEYPEIAQMLVEDLTEALAAPPEPADQNRNTEVVPAPTIKPEEINQAIESAISKVSQQYEAKLLTMQHKDWPQLVKEKEFDTFLKSLPGNLVPVSMTDGRVAQYPEKAKEYIESNDALVSAECFTKYKGWKAAQQQQRTRKQERLEEAVTPTGGSPPPPATVDDETAFQEGFKSVRGRAS